MIVLYTTRIISGLTPRAAWAATDSPWSVATAIGQRRSALDATRRKPIITAVSIIRMVVSTSRERRAAAESVILVATTPPSIIMATVRSGPPPRASA